MIKKILIFTFTLLLVVTPVVLGDAAASPRNADGEFIEIECKVLSQEVNMGEEFQVEVIITNLTQYKIQLDVLYVNISNYLDRYSFWTYDDGYATTVTELNAYESITIEFVGTVDNNISFYKDESGYYTDLYVTVDFYVDFGNTGDYYWQDYTCLNPIKIDNIYDDPGNIELTWYDKRDTMYYEYDEFYDDYDEVYPYYQGKSYYIIGIQNLSDERIGELQPGVMDIRSEKVYFEVDSIDDIPDTYKYTYSFMYRMGSDYYAATIDRVYQSELVEMPAVDIAISNVDGNYVFIVSNPNNYPIEDFCFAAKASTVFRGDDRYFRHGTLKSNEEWSFSCPVTENFDYYGILAGHLSDGVIYTWNGMLEFPEEGNKVNEPIVFSPNYYMQDYEYEINIDKYNDMMIELCITHTPTIETTSIATLIPTPDISPTPTLTSQAEVTIIKRQNPMLWALAVVLLLAIGAVVMITIAIAKKGKGEQK